MKPIRTIRELHDHVDGVMQRSSRHHVPAHIRKLIPAIVGGIVWQADPDSIEHMGKPDIGGNIVWCTIEGVRYAFCYNRHERRIEVRNRSQAGSVVKVFEDLQDVDDFFLTFGRRRQLDTSDHDQELAGIISVADRI